MVTQKNKAAHQKAQSASPIEPDRDANKKSRATQGIPNWPVPSSGQTRQQKMWPVLPGMILISSFVCSFVRSLVRLFVPSFVRLFVCSFVRPFVLRVLVAFPNVHY